GHDDEGGLVSQLGARWLQQKVVQLRRRLAETQVAHRQAPAESFGALGQLFLFDRDRIDFHGKSRRTTSTAVRQDEQVCHLVRDDVLKQRALRVGKKLCCFFELDRLSLAALDFQLRVRGVQSV